MKTTPAGHILREHLKPNLFLKIDDQEFVNECDVVARVVAVPHGQEDEGSGLAHQAVVEETKPLVDVRHYPCVGIDVEAVNQLKTEK